MKGGREGRDLDAIELAKAVEAMGAGEIMLNCIDNDGQGQVGAASRLSGKAMSGTLFGLGRMVLQVPSTA